jgi:tetratricopeptide (TPR) repeat protein
MDVQDFLIQGEGSEEDKRTAWQLFQQAYEQQMKGQLDEAVSLYKESLATHPTAEAYTFLGWTYSFMGRLDEAIEECHNAIACDPDFGNPYNDIGAYLIERANSKKRFLGSGKPWKPSGMRVPPFPISIWGGSMNGRESGPKQSNVTNKPWRSIPTTRWRRRP